MSQDGVWKWKVFLLGVSEMYLQLWNRQLTASELCCTQLVATQECIYHRTLCCPLQKACLTVEENICLKSRLQVAEAEAGQRQASSAEQDYEEVIQLLEAEIRDLKNQLASKRQARGVEATKVRLGHLVNYFRVFFSPVFIFFSLCSYTFLIFFVFIFVFLYCYIYLSALVS